ncbi:MAG: RNA 3'-terminal phosphate cyclase [Syntrophobacteraceae bacterium]
MIVIDGSLHSGSGTILRYAAALATLLRKPLHMIRIRAKREKPGLRLQHLQALRACAEISGGTLEGGAVGSQEIFFQPGKRPAGGRFTWDIGSAGSTTMLAMTVIPPALFAESPSRFTIIGGLFQDFAPSALYMENVLLPLLRRMGVNLEMRIARPGYVPQGRGELVVDVHPGRNGLSGIRLPEQGTVKKIRGVSLASHLIKEQVSRRMAEQSRRSLQPHGFDPQIRVLDDDSAPQKGAALLLWAETDIGCLIGSDRAGRPGRRSEGIADHVVQCLLEDMESGASTDRHLADQLILFASLAAGITEYRIPRITDHVESNLWLIESILGAKSRCDNNLLQIDGIGFRPS